MFHGHSERICTVLYYRDASRICWMMLSSSILVHFQSCSLTCHRKDVKSLGIPVSICFYVHVCLFCFIDSAVLLFGALIYNAAVCEHMLYMNICCMYHIGSSDPSLSSWSSMSLEIFFALESLYLHRFSHCSPGRLGIYCAVHTGLELGKILLHQAPKYWVYSHVSTYLAS